MLSGKTTYVSLIIDASIDAPIDINNEHPYTKIIKVLQCEMLELCLWDLKES